MIYDLLLITFQLSSLQELSGSRKGLREQLQPETLQQKASCSTACRTPHMWESSFSTPDTRHSERRHENTKERVLNSNFKYVSVVVRIATWSTS